MSFRPGLSTRLLAILLPEADREAVLQELEELYALRAERNGEEEARRWYRRQTWIFVWHLAHEGRRRGVRTGMSGFQAAMLDRERTGGGMGMGDLVMEARRAARRLVRAPVFTLVSVLTVAIGIGAFTSVFALAEAVLIEEMPYERPDELVWVWRDYVEADFPRGWLGGPDIVGMREYSDVFEGVVAFRSGAVSLTGRDGTNPVQVDAQLASPEFFDLLGVVPAAGRGFQPQDGLPEAAAVVVLAYDFWSDRFGADPSMLGESLYVDGEVTRVVGVAPRDFHFVKHSSLGEPVPADIYLPLRHVLADASPGAGMYAGLARVRSDAHPDQVTAALDGAAQEANDFMAQFDASPVRLWTVGLKSDLVSGVRPAIAALTGSAGFLLLILAANLATLLLGRASARQRELGVRMALGAARGRILMSVVSESVLLAVCGGAVGLALASAGTDLVIALAPEDLPRLQSVGLDVSVVATGVLVTAAMAAMAGLIPALFSMRAGVATAIKDGDARAGGSARGARSRGVLVVAQVALSLMLLVGGGLTVRAFGGLLAQDPGFDPAGTLTFTVRLDEGAYPASVDQGEFHRALEQRLAALPGVAGVGATTALPLTFETNQQGIGFLGAPGNAGDHQLDNPLIDWFRVTPGYFDAAGLRVLQGRGFDASDADSATFTVVIDDVLANRFFPDGGAIGASAEFFGDTATVVGVVDQARLYNVHSDDRGQVFVSAQRFPDAALSYAVRTGLDPLSLTPAVRQIVAEADGSIPVSEVRTLEEIVDGSLGEQRLSLTLILAFALGALVLASLGLYGVVSNGVTRRRQEIGVRMALGASADAVVRLVLAQGLRLAIVGALAGLVGAYAAAGVLDGIMFGVKTRDPLVYAVVALGLVVVAAVASWIPAYRATRIDPVEALTPE